MASTRDDQNDRRWMHESTAEVNIANIRNLAAVKEFAYRSFDQLDRDGNGFIELTELEDALENDALGNREKSFVMFLLNNLQQIAEMVHEEGDPNDGVSRQDLESYFQLLANLI
ncbi:MAG: EF-hand domain-containing protein [Candidatus Obscuribacterales bacterium]|jgi:Ca2+-binding EF-hand superfamily protein|nr:EF-hand domain-containing protein [Candidatus Obscuribacterales bacterium]